MKILLRDSVALPVDKINLKNKIVVGKSNNNFILHKPIRVLIIVVSDTENYFRAINIDSPLYWGSQYTGGGKESLSSLLESLNDFDFEVFNSMKDAFEWLEKD